MTLRNICVEIFAYKIEIKRIECVHKNLFSLKIKYQYLYHQIYIKQEGREEGKIQVKNQEPNTKRTRIDIMNLGTFCYC